MALAQRLLEREAIQVVWAWFLRNRNRDIPAVEVVARVRALAPGTDVERIRVEFGKRLRRAQRQFGSAGGSGPLSANARGRCSLALRSTRYRELSVYRGRLAPWRRRGGC